MKQTITTNINQASCPVCDATVTISPGTVVSEVISCPDCKSQLVVESLSQGIASLIKAPEVEEDWGE